MAPHKGMAQIWAPDGVPQIGTPDGMLQIGTPEGGAPDWRPRSGDQIGIPYGEPQIGFPIKVPYNRIPNWYLDLSPIREPISGANPDTTIWHPYWSIPI